MSKSANSPKHADIRQVAHEANVSIATVSRALSPTKSRLVAPETKRRILRVARKLNYRVNWFATGLRRQKSDTIGFSWEFLGEPTVMHLMHKLTILFTNNGYQIYFADIIHYTGTEIFDIFMKRQVDGIVLLYNPLMEQLLTQYRKYFKSVLLVSAQETKFSDCDNIIHDRLSAYNQIVDYLVYKGRKQFLFIGDTNPIAGKLDTVSQKLNSYGIPFDMASQSISFDPTTESFSILQLRLDQKINPANVDAVICTNDFIALKVMNWLQKKGFKIPEDISVTGFDNSEICEICEPQLASVERHNEQLASEIVDMTIRRLNKPELPQLKKTVKMSFHWRISAG